MRPIRYAPHCTPHNTHTALHSIHHTRHSVGFTFGDSIIHLISSHPNLPWLPTSVLSCRSVSDWTVERHGSNSADSDRHGMAWQRFLVHYYIFCGARREARGCWVICLFSESARATGLDSIEQTDSISWGVLSSFSVTGTGCMDGMDGWAGLGGWMGRDGWMDGWKQAMN